ncbi:9347_t:CDS:2 [Acaulospora colombiana]|uniref:9347_t:CDS:1 n=1 Tax=Acaulospora colombiana TaxID=27376 RepID=A0ACA9LAV0_9GLOM|nr:9347_t:CDS:2 [Acaulospora colombiana]
MNIKIHYTHKKLEDLYEGRTLRPETLDGTRIDPNSYDNRPSVELVINQTTSSLGLEVIESKVIALFNMVEKKFHVGEGQLLRVVVGACALLIIREEKIPKTMREVAFTLDLEMQHLTNVVHKIRMHLMPSVPSFIDVEVLVNKVIHDLLENHDNKFNLPIYVDIMQLDHLRQDVQVYDIQSESNYSEESVSHKEFQDCIMKYYRKVFTGICMQLLKYANEGNIITGKQPSPVGAAIVLIAIEATEKPSHDEWKNNHKRASDIVISLPWSFLAQENKSRSYLYVADLSQFYEWVSNCREKGKQKKHAMVDKGMSIEPESVVSTDLTDHNENRSSMQDYRDISDGHVICEGHESDVTLDDEELDEYMRNESEIEIAKNSWEDQESLDDQNAHDQKNKVLRKRRQVLREKGTFKKRKVDDQVENSQSDASENMDGDDVKYKTRKKLARTEKGSQKRNGREKELNSSKIKLNFDPSTVDMNLFDHI